MLSILFHLYFYVCRYLKKARYKKHQRKADKATHVFSVPKNGKKHAAVPAVTITTPTNSSKVAVSSNCNVRGVSFIIPRIEHPEEQSTTSTIVCKPFEPNNISSSIGNLRATYTTSMN